MSRHWALAILGTAVALGIAGCGGTIQSQGHSNLRTVNHQRKCGAGILVTVDGIENSTETYPAINCKTAVDVGTALADAKHIDTTGLRVGGYSWGCHVDDSIKDGGDAVCDTNKDLLVGRIRIIRMATYLPAEVAKAKPQPVVPTSATTTTTTAVPAYVNGGKVDQSNPRPPCPSTDVVSGATGNVYCLIASQQPPATTATPTPPTTETTTSPTQTTPLTSSSGSPPTGGITGPCPPSDGGNGKCAGIPVGQPCC
jgi:hypothetical protein